MKYVNSNRRFHSLKVCAKYWEETYESVYMYKHMTFLNPEKWPYLYLQINFVS
jgi:hypothetical protein